MTIVRGVPVGEGWLAWNKVVSRFDPKTPAKALLAMMAATQPKKVRDIRDLPSAIEDWESKVKILKEEHNADIDEKIKVALLTSMLPSDIQDYVFQQADKDDFAEIRDKVVTLAVNRASLSRPKPMEVDQVGWGERNSGEQYNDEENPEEDDSSINYVGGKSGGKHGKGGKGFGKSKGKGFQGYCYTCGELGHAARECPKGKGKGKVWGGDWDKGGDRKDCPSVKGQAVEGAEEPAVLFIGRVDNWVDVPRSNRDPTVARQKVGFQHRGKDRDHVEPPPGLLTNRLKVLEADEDDEEQVGGQEVCNIRTVAAKSDKKDSKKKCQTDDEWLNLGIGEIVVDSAADESCWPIGVGDAFPTRPSKRNILLKTANGGEMGHYGEKCITFTHDGDGGKEVVGLKFQVTDVRKPLLAVRRLVEHGSVVSFGAKDEDCYIFNPATNVRIPMTRKSGSFVIKARFMKSGFARPV